MRRRPNLLLCEIFQQEYELGECRMSEDACYYLKLTIFKENFYSHCYFSEMLK